MEKHQSRDDLIAALTADMTPVRRVRPRDGAAMIVCATLAAGIACVMYYGFWFGAMTGEASPFYWISNGLLGVVGVASTTALVASANPRIGHRSSASQWSTAILAVLPIAAMITLISIEAGHDHGMGMDDPGLLYWKCAARGLAASSVIALAGIWHLRRGAPVSLERAGWLIGLSSGALGALAYNITCPLDSLLHIGFWHVTPAFIGAIFWRFAAPPLIRW